MIKFIKISSPTEVSNYIVETIRQRLRSGQKLLWLVPGGSAIRVAVDIAKQLKNEDLSNLYLGLTDERYGPAGHDDSNWRQLEKAGFSLKGATIYEVLNGGSLDEEANKYEDFLNKAVNQADYSIALAGLGPDGHIFGIKPGSPALKTSRGVIGYKWNDYTRLTPAFKLLKNLDEVVIYAVGREKHAQFDLLNSETSADIQPAQLLKRLKRVRIYNDYKGGKV